MPLWKQSPPFYPLKPLIIGSFRSCVYWKLSTRESYLFFNFVGGINLNSSEGCQKCVRHTFYTCIFYFSIWQLFLFSNSWHFIKYSDYTKLIHFSSFYKDILNSVLEIHGVPVILTRTVPIGCSNLTVTTGLWKVRRHNFWPSSKPGEPFPLISS